MQVRRGVVHAFDVGGAGTGRPRLDLAEFSRFKHGAVAPAWRFAAEMVRRLAADSPETVDAPDLVLTASCYKFVPLASVTLARCVGYLLNRRRAETGLAQVIRTQFYRGQLIEGDYSTMPLDQRQRFIEQDVVRIDAEPLDGATVLVIDDLRITGFHEGRLAEVLAAAGVPAATFAYCAVVDGRGDPTVERRMNQTSVADLATLAKLADRDGFVLNSRVCKLILSAPLDQLPEFLAVLPPRVLADLVNGMECNGYAVMGRYRPAYELMAAVRDAAAAGAVR